MKYLAKSKMERIKRKAHKYIINQKDMHMKLQLISSEHKYSIFEFYVEFYRNNYQSIKNNKSIEEMMFTLSKSILNESDLPSKDLKNVIDFCTFILKNSDNEAKLTKITDCSRAMIFSNSTKEETIRNSISSFIKMIYFNPISINDI